MQQEDKKEDKKYRVLMFPSVHYVMRAEKLLRDVMVFAESITAPREFTPDCGVALLIRKEDLEQALSVLKEKGLAPEAVHPYDK